MTSPAPSTPSRRSAQDVLATLLDPGTFSSWDEPIPAATGTYAAELAAAADKAGTDESILTGSGSLGGHRVAVIVSEFSFLAGSIGAATAGRIVAAFERAAQERLPVLALPASGGTRMQEGTPAFVTMVSIADAVAAYRQTGLPYLTFLRNPTTGGVYASWGSLGHLTLGEAGATIGFLGARVYEALYDAPFPTGVQTAENLAAHGVIDAALSLGEFAELARRLLDILALDPEASDATSPVDGEPAVEPVPADEVWDAVLRTRRPERPGVRALLEVSGAPVVVLSGTGAGERDSALVLAVTAFGDHPCVVVGQDRDAPDPIGAGGLRTARRGMRLAAELGLPLVTVIDTSGAELSGPAEECAIAGEIARCLADLVTLEVPTVALLLGEGTGGGALALLPADRVLAARNSWVSPLPPEGASAILHRTPDRAPELAAAQQIGAASLQHHGIVDELIAEQPDAADEPEAFTARAANAVARALASLADGDGDARRAARHTRWRQLAR